MSGHDVTQSTGIDPVAVLRTDRSEAVVAVCVHRRDMAPLVVALAGRRPTVLIGRSEQADLRLHDEHISRLHGLLRKDGTRWTYVELGSANGSYIIVGGQRALLKSGGSVTLTPDVPIFLGNDGNRLDAMTSLPDSDVNADTCSAAGLQFETELAAVAKSKLPVFLLGPSGSGKTWAAQVLHERSGRKGRFIAINCARLPTDIGQLTSELLGHVKNAFTGANDDRVGQVFAADRGTLFLDEVESLSAEAQGFLLDVIEGTGSLLPLGMASTSAKVPPRPVVRVISASKATLKRSKLRNDLCQRLVAGEVIEVPSLHQRRDDIPGLVERVRQAADVDDEDQRPVFSKEAVAALQKAQWPGEIRALRAAVTTLVDRAARSGKRIIDAAAVRERLEQLRVSSGDNDFDDEQTGAFRARPTLVNQPAIGKAGKPSSRHANVDDVVAALAGNSNNIDRTAQWLGWSRNTLTKKMDDFGIARPGRLEK